MSDLRLFFKNHYCFANNERHFVINADGNLYKCEHAILNEDRGYIGDLDNGITNLTNYNFWKKVDYPYQKCDSCPFLFMCGGGCKHERYFAKYDFVSCIWLKDILAEIITMLYNKES